MNAREFLGNVAAHQRALESAKSIYRDRLAPDFTPFDFIDGDELTLSRLLAWLLDPRASHSQGSRFPQLLLEGLNAGWPAEAVQQATTWVEFPIRARRIDILVQSSARMLAIENKPSAVDQPDQIARYLDFLDSSSLSEFQLVYLTPSGAPPSPLSISERDLRKRLGKKQVCLWAYRNELLVWLDKCRSACRADRVATFIDEFSGHVRKTFEGMRNMSDQDQLLAEVMRSNETVAAAMEVIIAAPAIRSRLTSMARGQVEEIARSEEWTLTWNMSERRWTGFSLEVLPSSECEFRVEFEYSGYNGLAYGVRWKDTERHHDERTREMLEEHLGSGEESPVWPWWRYTSLQEKVFPIEAHWGSSVGPWLSISNGELSNIVLDGGRHFREVLASWEG
jgi:hypothetical protein